MASTVNRFLSSEAALEAAAAVEHERWSHWQAYLHSQSERGDDGSLRIPSHLVERWERQITTPYSELPEAERESDREQARQFLAALGDVSNE